MVEVEICNIGRCVVAWGGTGISAGTMLAAGDLSCFGCPVLLYFSNSGNGACHNHDGEEVVAIDIGGEVKESDDNNHEVGHKATSPIGSAGMMLLHYAAMTAAVAEYIEGGCFCALRFKLSMFKLGNCQFLNYFLWALALIFSWWCLN
jgi:hypothetical protein